MSVSQRGLLQAGVSVKLTQGNFLFYLLIFLTIFIEKLKLKIFFLMNCDEENIFFTIVVLVVPVGRSEEQRLLSSILERESSIFWQIFSIHHQPTNQPTNHHFVVSEWISQAAILISRSAQERRYTQYLYIKTRRKS